jgi:hypothetical protein
MAVEMQTQAQPGTGESRIRRIADTSATAQGAGMFGAPVNSAMITCAAAIAGSLTGGTIFRLDYLSCCLTIMATVLVGRKSWTGLLISIVNSLIVCVIGFRTSQFGFIPANLICIGVYAFSIRSWLKKTHTHRTRTAA